MNTALRKTARSAPTHTPALPPARRRFLLTATALTALSLAALGGCTPTASAADRVNLDQARQAHEGGQAVLIDIREPLEHATGVAPGAQLLPMSQLKRRLQEIPVDPARPVLLICHTQNRSSATLRALRDSGYSHVRFVDGGMSEWARRGWPLVKPGG